MSILDIIIFLFFTGGVVVFGCSFFNKKRSSEEFTSAGRSLPGWVVGMSIFATYVSSISYLAYPGKAYMSDWNAFVFSLSIPIASYFAAKYFCTLLSFYRKRIGLQLSGRTLWTLGACVCVIVLSFDAGCPDGFYSVSARIAYECPAGMGYQDDYRSNQRCHYCLFNVGWSESCDMDGGDSRIYSDRRCGCLSLCADV